MTDYFDLAIYLAISCTLSGICFIVYLILKSHKDPKTVCGTTLTYVSLFEIGAYTFGWYSISVGLTIYNKWLLSELYGGFKFPLLSTSVHMLIKYLLSRLWYQMCPITIPVEENTSFNLLIIIILIGATTAGDIALSNESILYLNVTLYTTMKSIVLIFTFMWSICLQVEKFSYSTFIAVLLIISGVGLAVSASSQFTYFGLFLSILGSCLAGLRWALIQYLLLYDTTTPHNAIVAVYRFSPYSFIAILPIALLTELEDFIHSPYNISNFHLFSQILGLVCFAGILAFGLILLEVKLVQLTSSLTLGVIGQVKEIVQITLSIIMYHDHVTIQSILGIILALLATQYYQYIQLTSPTSIKNRKNPPNILPVTRRYTRRANSAQLIKDPRLRKLFGLKPTNSKFNSQFTLFPIEEVDENRSMTRSDYSKEGVHTTEDGISTRTVSEQNLSPLHPHGSSLNPDRHLYFESNNSIISNSTTNNNHNISPYKHQDDLILDNDNDDDDDNVVDNYNDHHEEEEKTAFLAKKPPHKISPLLHTENNI